LSLLMVMVAATMLLISGGSMAGACPETLNYLAARLPAYNDPDLIQLRNAALSTDLQAALRMARSQGLSPQQAAAATLAQARQAQAAMPQAEACIRQASTDPGSVIRGLQTGTYRMSGGSITSTCAKAYVLAYYEMIVNREAAIGISCWASQR
jgi:hypothetical protein